MMKFPFTIWNTQRNYFANLIRRGVVEKCHLKKRFHEIQLQFQHGLEETSRSTAKNKIAIIFLSTHTHVTYWNMKKLGIMWHNAGGYFYFFFCACFVTFALQTKRWVIQARPESETLCHTKVYSKGQRREEKVWGGIR